MVSDADVDGMVLCLAALGRISSGLMEPRSSSTDGIVSFALESHAPEFLESVARPHNSELLFDASHSNGREGPPL
jgi:hypothetical protein